MAFSVEQHRLEVRALVRHARGNLTTPNRWRPQVENRAQYVDLRAQLGASEARRIITEHEEVVARRKQNAPSR